MNSCVDEVDKKQKWSKRAVEQLEKLNNHCNSTAGLEANFVLAVGAHAMLRTYVATVTLRLNCSMVLECKLPLS